MLCRALAHGRRAVPRIGDARTREILYVRLMLFLSGAFLEGKEAPTLKSLSEAIDLDEAYIAEAIERFSDNCEFIDLRSLLTEFMNDMGLEEFTRLKAEIGNEIYASNNYSEGTFYALIVKRITDAMAGGKIPVLIHTGTIYGMGFSNNNIMEEKVVLSSRIPLVVFYPATVENGTIKFLGKQNASKYRCIVIQ